MIELIGLATGGSALTLFLIKEVYRLLWKQTDINSIKLDTLTQLVTSIQVKVDTLWEIYTLDALKQSRKSHLVQTNSPEIPSDLWRELDTNDVTEHIKSIDKQRLTKNLGKLPDEYLLLILESLKNTFDI